MNRDGMMSKDNAIVKLRADQWSLVNRFQERIMPLLYGVGHELEIGEVDLKPGPERVLVYCEYKDRRTVFDFEVIPVPHLIGDVEMKAERLPEWVPLSLFESLPKFDECQGLHVFVNDGRLWLRMPVARVQGSGELHRIIESMAEGCDRIEEALSEPDDERETMAKVTSALHENSAVEKMLN